MKKLLICILVSVHGFLFSMQPTSLTCQSLRATVEKVLKTGDRSSLETIKIINPTLYLAGQYLISAKNDVNRALLLALLDEYLSKSDETEIIKFFRSCGADVGFVSDIVGRIKFSGYSNALKDFIDKGKFRALQLILGISNKQIQKYLEKNGQNLLIYIMQSRYPLIPSMKKFVELLLDAGAKPYIKTSLEDPAQVTPLSVAVVSAIDIPYRTNSEQVCILALDLIERLVKAGADIHERVSINSSNLLEIAVSEARDHVRLIEQAKRVIEKLLSLGIDINEPPLHSPSYRVLDMVNPGTELYNYLRSLGAKHAKEPQKESCAIS